MRVNGRMPCAGCQGPRTEPVPLVMKRNGRVLPACAPCKAKPWHPLPRGLVAIIQAKRQEAAQHG